VSNPISKAFAALDGLTRAPKAEADGSKVKELLAEAAAKGTRADDADRACATLQRRGGAERLSVFMAGTPACPDTDVEEVLRAHIAELDRLIADRESQLVSLDRRGRLGAA
jgi:hypothetical protein